MSRYSGNLQAGVGQLREAWEKLSVRWGDTRDHWQDANARRFEEEELALIADELGQVLPVIAHMSQVIGAAERDLNDKER